MALVRGVFWPEPGHEEMFLAAILVSAIAGGMLPGLLATLISSLVSAYVFLPPTYSIAVVAWGTELWLLAILGVVTSVAVDGVRRSRKRLRDALRLHELTLASIGDGVITTDPHGRVTFVNAVAEELIGWPSADAVGRRIDDVLNVENDETGERTEDPIRTTLRTQQAQELLRATLIARDGRRIPIADSAAPIRNDDGEISGTVLVFRDATVERRVEQEMRERLALQEELERVARTAPGILYSFRLRPDGSACIPFASPRINDIFGFGRERLAEDASPIFEMMRPEEARRAQESIAQSARTMRPWRELLHLTRPDGAELWLEGHSLPTAEPDGSIVWHGFINDVTEQWKVVQALRSAREMQHLLIEQAPISIAMLDRNMNYVATSRRWRTEFGHGEETLAGRNHYEVLPDVPDGWRVWHRECLAGAVCPEGEVEWVRGDGTITWVRRAIHPWSTAAGDIGGIIIFAEDVTERRRQAAALKEREARFSGIINSAMDAIITVDEAQTIVLANPAAERVFGWRAADLIGSELNKLLPERHRAGHARYVDRYATDGMTHRRGEALRPLVGLRSSGEEFPLEATISQVEVGGQRLATVILRDISERTRAEEALRDSNERFSQLAESISEVFWLVAADLTRIEYLSPAFKTVWGRPVADAYASPKAWFDCVHELDRERIADIVPTLAEREHDTEYRIVRPDGAVRWIRDRSFPVRDGEGTVIRIAGVAEDITDRRALEEQLRQAQKLESVGQLAGGVAHDFNNWLTVISANCQFALQALPADHEAVECLTEVRRAGDKAASLTRQLLTFSRQQVADARVMDLNAAVMDTEKMLRRLIGEDVALETDLRTTRQVFMDPGQVGQVLMNLAVNARDAMPAGGRLTIETADVQHVPGAGGRAQPGERPYVRLRVSDTGAGMTPHVKARVFEPFFTTKGLGHGTGLGLAVVHGIVQQAGGQIDVESEVGIGTTFMILLAATERDAGESIVVEHGVARRGTETVLLVEDEVLVRRVASRMLREAGYAVLEAASGHEAVRIAAEHSGSIDLLFTDVVMPGMNGREVAEEVVAITPSTRVLFASGYLDNSILRNGVQSASVLRKPYDSATLLARIRQSLEATGATAIPA